jgi:glycosyltransferase involved in cell wall biosynthesis
MGVIRNVPLKNEVLELKEVRFPTPKRTILYQGILNPGRGLKPMIKALKFIDNLDLIIIGYGKVEEELKDFVLQEKMNSRVYFLGRISRETLVNYTKKATLGMVLEEPLGKSFEYSLPNKLFDYIHAELPIITGNMPEISKVIQHYKVGVMIDGYSPRKIAEKINEVLNSPDLILEIKEHQKKAKEILCWENECKQLETYFK